MAMPTRFPRRICAAAARETSQTVSRPMIVDPSRLPTAPTANATATETTGTANVANALAPMTRSRLGTIVNVVSPLRWLHSLVTHRIAIIGRITDTGGAIAAVTG